MSPRPYYSAGAVTIYHGDSREIIPELTGGPFDLVLTDPPYGIGADRGQANRAGRQDGAAAAPSRDYGEIRFDHAAPDAELLFLVLSAGREAIIWGGNYFALPISPAWLVWDKDNGSNHYADAELAWTNLGFSIKRFRWRWHGMIQERMGDEKEGRVHPTQKPLAVMAWCIGLPRERPRSVLDPFMGSGTTLLAAKRLGIPAVGIEREEAYCEAAAKRLAQEVLAL